LLASEGYRVIVPYVRGCGTTRFLSDTTFRNGQTSVVAVDTIALMDALKIDKAILAGFDWGARTADAIASLWPERCKALVSVSGYLFSTPESNKMPLPPLSSSLASPILPPSHSSLPMQAVIGGRGTELAPSRTTSTRR